MGIFDQLTSMNPDQAQGLLAAAAQMLQQSGPSRTPTSFGQVMGGGMQAYQASTEAARRRKLEEEQAAQQKALYGLKIRDFESDFTNQEASRKRATDLQNFYKNRSIPQTPAPSVESMAEEPIHLGATPQASTPGMLPRLPAAPATANPSVFEQRMKLAEELRAKGFAAEADAQEAAALKFQPEFDQTPRVGKGADGKVFSYVLDKQGNRKVLDGVLPRDEMKLADLGGTQEAYDPFNLRPGQKFAKTMTTSDRVAIRGQDKADARALEANRIALGGAALKPMPATALKMQQAELDALGTASGVQMDIARIEKQLQEGKLDFGPVSNLVDRGLNATGLSTERSRNFGSFKATLEKMRNDSLRLNTGVQTDGDAQRAWNELFSSINDKELVQQRLAEIKNINARAVQLRKMNVDGIRANYGRDPLDTSKYEPPASAPAAPANDIDDLLKKYGGK